MPQKALGSTTETATAPAIADNNHPYQQSVLEGYTPTNRRTKVHYPEQCCPSDLKPNPTRNSSLP